MTDAQFLQALADLLERAFPERVDTTRLRDIASLMGMDQHEPDPCDACCFWLGEGWDKCGVCGRTL